MNIVFFGSSSFGGPSLESLLDSKHRIFCVVTQPDRQKGRGLVKVATPIKILALNKRLKFYQPDNVNSTQSIELLKSLKADLFIVIAYGQILSADILRTPKIFSINLHASLLPKYRGAAPINWAIINGETLTGLTIIKMNEKIDAGEIILQKKVDIEPTDTEITLEERLAKQGADLLLECLNKMEEDSLSLLRQDETLVSFAPKLNKNDGLIDWQKEAVKIQNLIRGVEEWPAAFTYYKGKILKIFKVTISSPTDNGLAGQPGEVVRVDKKGILVATGKYNLLIEELQLQGGRRMKVEEFICGHQICAGERLSKK
ncbi:MAG: methionyl-tRNA formyltransferase [Candidatus Omnitrophota bacterium]|nr:methionyl-tRNA formyltransferase [Candidatus Omnitrophota bacterium]